MMRQPIKYRLKNFSWGKLSLFSFLLLFIGTALMIVYLTLLWKSKDVSHLAMSCLFLLASGNLLWEKRHELTTGSSLLAKLVGAALILWMLFHLPLSPQKNDFNPYLRSAPFVFALSLSWIASGFRRTQQYWRELLILFCLGIPSILLNNIDVSVITAKFGSAILWALNFDAYQQGVYIHLPTAIVKVDRGCSGMESMIYLFGIAIIYLVTFPLKRIQYFIMPIVAIIIGFITNIFRVALMVVLVASERPEAFKYWHEGQGSLVVGMIAIIIFSLFYFLFLSITYSDQEELEETQI